MTLTQQTFGKYAKVSVCVDEDDDYDCILKGVDESRPLGDQIAYRPVQLKELVPHELDPDTDLQRLLDPLKLKYATSHDLILCIWINRNINLLMESIHFDGFKVHQIWFIGDTPSSSIMIDGGTVADLLDGVYSSCEVKGATRTFRCQRFKPSPTRVPLGDSGSATSG